MHFKAVCVAIDVIDQDWKWDATGTDTGRNASKHSILNTMNI
jgi:hypothetical protein